MDKNDWELAYEGMDPADTAQLVDKNVKAVAKNLNVGTSLDLGCGFGHNSIWLAEQGWHATGVDLVPKAINEAKAEARKRGVSVLFELSDVTEWRPPRLYDLVISTFALPGVKKRDTALKVAMSATRPGGNILIVEIERGAAENGLFDEKDLASLDEIRESLHDFEITRSEVLNYDHGHGESLPTLIVEGTKKMAN